MADDDDKKSRFGLRKLGDVVKGTLAAATGGPVDVSKLTPEQRAKYEAGLAAREAKIQAAEVQWQQAEQIGAEARAAQVIQGPAQTPAPPTAAEIAAMARGDGSQAMAHTRDQLRTHMTGAQQMLTREGMRSALYELFLNINAPDGRTPEERAELAFAEWEAREAALASYRSADAPPVFISRFTTKGRDQIAGVRNWLQASGLAARPDLVYGLYRVPDRINPHLDETSERFAPVEWDVVHSADSPLPASSAEIALSEFERDRQWIARRVGEPTPLDEEMGAWFCEWAAIEPEACFGLPRMMKITGVQMESVGDLVPRIRGVGVFHRPTPHAGVVTAHLEAHAPVVRAPGGPLHVELLDWGAIVAKTNVLRNGPAPVPSDLPHLPATGEELLLAYLAVVGVRPQDCYQAAVTVRDRRAPSGIGPKMPMSDGEARRRYLYGDTVVVVYRDAEDYVEGRQRWAAYQSDVLMARLDHLTAQRDPVRPPPAGWERALLRVERFTDFFATDAADEPPRAPHPYCWPPRS